MDTASNKVIADVDASVTIQLLLLIDSGPRDNGAILVTFKVFAYTP